MSLTLNTPGTTYFDDASNLGLGNGGSIALSNQAVLVVDSDTRWGQNAACPAAVSIATTGGTYWMDGTRVQWVEFQGGSSGTVPALGTRGTNDVKLTNAAGALVGEFLGVWTNLGTSPLAAGTALPSHGFVKFRNLNQSLAANTVLYFVATGGTVTTSGASVPGWIHVVHTQGTYSTINAPGVLKSTGDWFTLGTINGSYNQTFQFPVADQCPAVQVETAAGSNTWEWWTSGGPHGDPVGDPTFKWGTGSMIAYNDIRGKFFGCSPTGELEFYRRMNADTITRLTVTVATTAALTGTLVAASANAAGGTFTLTATGSLIIDGYTTALNDRILLKNQATGTQNGIYTVTTAGTTGVAAVLTRAVDWNRLSGVRLANRTYVNVTNGAVNGGLWFPLRNAVAPDVTTTVNFPGAEALQFTPVRVATTTNLSTYSGGVITGPAEVLTVDGVALNTNDRVLVLNQTNTVENGVYVVTDAGTATRVWVLTRDADCDTGAAFAAGAYTNVRDGVTYKGQRWQITSAVAAVGTSAFTWNRISDSFLGAARVAGAVSTTVTNALYQYVSASGIMAAVALGAGTPGIGTARVVATSNLSVSGSTTSTLTGTGLLGTIDGVSSWTANATEASADKILLVGQSTASQNGLYYLSANATNWTLTRSVNMGVGISVWTTRSYVFVYGGTANNNTYWFLTGQVASLGTDANNWTSVAAPPFLPCAYTTGSALPNAPNYAAGVLTATANAALVVDGVTPALNDRVLVRGQATATQNGIYTVTAVGSAGSLWSLTRSTDFTTGPLQMSREVAVTGGSSCFNTKYYLDATVTTVDVDGVTWIPAEFAPVALATTAALLGTPSYSNGVLTPTVGTGSAFANVTWATIAALANTPGYASGVMTATVTGRLVVDGVYPAVGDRILVKNEATTTRNGIYVVNDDGSSGGFWQMTRSSDFNTGPLAAQSVVYVTGGAMYASGGNTLGMTYWYLSAVVTTIDVTAVTWVQGGLTVDGINPTVGTRVLVKNEATTTNNGLYVVTTAGANYVLTRASDFATAVQPIYRNRVVRVRNGLTLANTYWYLAGQVATIGTTSVVFSQTTAELTLDSVKVQAGDNVLLTGQVPTTQNAVYACQVNGAGWTLMRVANCTNALTPIYYGSYAVVNAQGTMMTDVRLATTTHLPYFPGYSNQVLTATVNGALFVDGLNAYVGDRILVKNQSDTTQNGTYVVTAAGSSGALWSMTRATDMNSNGLVKYQYVTATSGYTNFVKSFLLALPVPVLDASPVVWIPYLIGTGTNVSNDVQYSWSTTVGLNQIDVTAVTWVTMRGSACGYPPPVGARVRIPNVIAGCTLANGGYLLNTIDVNSAVRCSFATVNAPWDLSNFISPSWWFSNNQIVWPSVMSLKNSVFADCVQINGAANASVIDNIAVSTVLFTTATSGTPGVLSGGAGPALFLLNTHYPFTVSNSRFTKLIAHGQGTIFVTQGLNVNCNNLWVDTFVSSTATYERTNNWGIRFDSGGPCTLSNITLVGNGLQSFSENFNLKLQNFVYADRHCGTTTANAGSTVIWGGFYQTVDGISLLGNGTIPNIHPYLGIVAYQGGFSNVIQNVGTRSQPLDMGTPYSAFSATQMANNGNGGGGDDNIVFRRIYVRNAKNGFVAGGSGSYGNVIYDNVWLQTPAVSVGSSYNGCSLRGVWFNDAITTRIWGDHLVNDNWGQVTLYAAVQRLDYTLTDQVVLTGSAIVPALLPAINDSIEFIGYYYVLGYTQIYDLVFTESNTANYTKTYMIDLNDGLSWKSASGVGVYDTLTTAKVAAWTIDPAKGFKLRVKYKANVASSSNTITKLTFTMRTTPALTNTTLYPNMLFAWYTVTGLVAGARLQVFNVTQNQELVNTVVSGTSYMLPWYTALNYEDTVRIRVVALGYQCYSDNVTLTGVLSTQWTWAVTLVADPVYVANAINGSTVSDFTANVGSNLIQVGVNSSTFPKLYAWYQNLLVTNGTALASWFNALYAIRTNLYAIQTTVAPLKLTNLMGTPASLSGGTLYCSDLSSPVSGSTVSSIVQKGATFRVTPISGQDSALVSFDPQRAVYYV